MHFGIGRKRRLQPRGRSSEKIAPGSSAACSAHSEGSDKHCRGHGNDLARIEPKHASDQGFYVFTNVLKGVRELSALVEVCLGNVVGLTWIEPSSVP